MDRFTLRYKKLHPDAIPPHKAHPSDMGWDLYSLETVELAPHQRKVISTGIAFRFPENIGGIIKDRSGLASKFGLHTMAGVIDPNYTGECGVVLLNTGTVPVKVDKGDRIGQMILMPVFQVSELLEVTDLGETDRGASGYGSTGK